MSSPSSNDTTESREEKVFSILSYLSVLCIIPLISFSKEGVKENPFVLHHAKQGLVIFIAEVAVFILHIVLGQWFLKSGIFVLGIASLVGIISVLQGKFFKIPVISDIAEKIIL